MLLKTADGVAVELTEVPAQLASDNDRLVVRSAELDDRAGRVARAAAAVFDLRASERLAAEPPLGVFREAGTNLLRVVHKELVVRWAAKAPAATRKKILADHGLEQVGKSPFVANQVVVRGIPGSPLRRAGIDLVPLSNTLTDLAEVVFATPNFVSEYQRSASAIPAIPAAQWHLRNTGAVAGQTAGEDVKAADAWRVTRGKASIVVAVLDDGVDVDHPNLKPSVRKKPDPTTPADLVGRDFFVPPASPDHFDPRPKLFQFPYDRMAGNDIHGTPCAGVIAAAGKNGGAVGIAPKCKVLAVKVFHADSLASDARVAAAIRYAARVADVISCSWSGGRSSDIEFALRDAAAGRGGKGTAVICAAGNDRRGPVGFPANSANAVAVGASTDGRQLAYYSNVGPELWVVAPSSGGARGIFTTDVSTPNRGFNLGTAAAGGADGLHTNDFGGTSSATPLVAGVAALVLSVNPDLTRDQVKAVLRDTADRIGPNHDAQTGHSNDFGYGRVNAAQAVARAKALRRP